MKIEDILKQEEQKIQDVVGSDKVVTVRHINLKLGNCKYYNPWYTVLCIDIDKFAKDEKGSIWRFNKGSIGYELRVFKNAVTGETCLRVVRYAPKFEGDSLGDIIVKDIKCDIPDTKLKLAKSIFTIFQKISDKIKF